VSYLAPQILIAEAILIMLALALGKPTRWGWAIIIGIISLAVSATGETQAVVILGLLAFVCIGRGIQLVISRQIPRGIVLILLAIPLGGTGPAFRGWPPMSGLYERDFRDLVAYQIHLGKRRADPQGRPRYVRPGRDERGWVKLLGVQVPFLRWGDHLPWVFALDYTQPRSSDSFETWLVPHRFPSFPYNHLVSLPTLYADETGTIRKVDVCTPGERCPPDAPVVYRVTEADLEDIAGRIRSASGGR
jgi:hypothetical protein